MRIARQEKMRKILLKIIRNDVRDIVCYRVPDIGMDYVEGARTNREEPVRSPVWDIYSNVQVRTYLRVKCL